MNDDDLMPYLSDYKFMKLMNLCLSELTKGEELDIEYVKENIDRIYNLAKEDTTKWATIGSLFCVKEMLYLNSKDKK